tara:strand:+ start:49 stop:636 length:588 start_codon:yes stop_codon:yes gene_type:complete
MVPKLYKSIVIDRFNIIPDDTNAVHKEIFNADMAIIIIFLLNFGCSFASISIYYIMFISAFAIASYALIQFNKTQSAFMTTDSQDASYKPDAKFQPEGAGWFGWFKTIGVMLTALTKLLPNSPPDSYRYMAIPYLIFAAASFFIILSINYALKYQSADENKKAEVEYFNGETWINPLVLSLTVISPILMLVINNK